MSRITISFAESALADLEQVRAQYAEQGVPEAGKGLIAEVLQRVQALADRPDMGRLVSEFDQTFLRELIDPSFIGQRAALDTAGNSVPDLSA